MTGTYVTTQARVLDVQLGALAEPLGTTPPHPFYSLDRLAWVAAGDLRPAETVATAAGGTVVYAVALRPTPATVYNLEVAHDHTYFVTAAKVWVHNACPIISAKIKRQMPRRGWTEGAISEAMERGERIRAVNKANGNPATRYVHPSTGQSVVVDDVTNEVIHVGGPGFTYGPDSGDLP